jgi:signal transduction histidine kinase
MKSIVIGRKRHFLKWIVVFSFSSAAWPQEIPIAPSVETSPSSFKPEIFSPGTTNAPGPILDTPIVTFSWKPVPGATEYSISIRSLLTSNLFMTNVDAAQTDLTMELRKHPYRWNMRAFKGEQEGVFSDTFYFQVEASSGHPIVTGVSPFPVAGKSYKQHFTISGRDFFLGCIVNLREKSDSNHLYSDIKIELQTPQQITINPNFSSETGDWTVEIINPHGESSGEFPFRVLSPADMAKYESDRKNNALFGWLCFKRTLAAAIFLGIASAGLFVFLNNRNRKRRHDAHHAGSEKERERWTAELHESLGPDLVSAIKVCERLGTANLAGEQKELVSVLQAALLGAQRDIEDLLWATKPENQRLNWLIGRLRQNARFILEAAGISFRPEFPAALPERPVSAEICNHLLLLTKEALNNAVKHSGAKNVFMGLLIEADSFRLTISDDGTGFDMEKLSPGSGLRNMRWRMEKIEGTFEMKSSPGSGTCISIQAPLRI